MQTDVEFVVVRDELDIEVVSAGGINNVLIILKNDASNACFFKRNYKCTALIAVVIESELVVLCKLYASMYSFSAASLRTACMKSPLNMMPY